MKKVYALTIIVIFTLPLINIANAQGNSSKGKEMSKGNPAQEKINEKVDFDITQNELREGFVEKIGVVGEKTKESFESIMNEEDGFLQNKINKKIPEQVKGRVRELIQKKKKTIQERRRRMLERREERKTKLSEQKRERVGNLIDNMFLGFSNSAERLNNIIERLETVIENKKEEGVDISDAEEKLTEVKKLLEETFIDIDLVSSELKTSIEDEISKEYIKDLVSIAKESIRNTHEGLREVISEINN